MLREREQKSLETNSENPSENDGGALLLNAFRFTFQCAFWWFLIHFSWKMVPGGLQDRQRDLKNNKNSHNLFQKGCGMACPPPLWPKMSVPRPQMGSPKCSKITEKEVWKSLFFFNVSLRPIFLGGLNPSESCSHAGKTPDFEKSTFSGLGVLFLDFGPLLRANQGSEITKNRFWKVMKK